MFFASAAEALRFFLDLRGSLVVCRLFDDDDVDKGTTVAEGILVGATFCLYNNTGTTYVDLWLEDRATKQGCSYRFSLKRVKGADFDEHNLTLSLDEDQQKHTAEIVLTLVDLEQKGELPEGDAGRY